MSSDDEGLRLTAEEYVLASQHWEALMFAFSCSELGSAQLALLQAPIPVQHAVIASINDHWLRDYTPTKGENPFLLKNAPNIRFS